MSNNKNENIKSSENKSIIKSKNEDSNKSERKSKTKDRLKFGYPVRFLIVEPTGNYCKTVWCAIGIGVSHVMIGATVMTMLIHSIKTGDNHVGMCTFAHISKMYTIILDPGGQYWKIIFCYFLVGIAQLMIGATLGIVFMYCLKTGFEDVHVIWCTFGYHFFSAEAILSLNYANGWSSPMRLRHRRFTHVFLQMCAMACAITGTALITISKGISDSAHGVTGVASTVLAGITFLSGPCALFGGRYLKILHVSVGMPTFLVSSICLCLGASTSAFQNWAGATVVYILVAFVTFYTTFIIVTCFLKCVTRI